MGNSSDEFSLSVGNAYIYFDIELIEQEEYSKLSQPNYFSLRVFSFSVVEVADKYLLYHFALEHRIDANYNIPPTFSQDTSFFKQEIKRLVDCFLFLFFPMDGLLQ